MFNKNQKDKALKMAIEWFEKQGYSEDRQDIIDYCKPALTEPETVTLPDGWVAVPVKPTDAMLDAGRGIVKIRYVDSDIAAYETYKAMLQAAPTLNEKG